MNDERESAPDHGTATASFSANLPKYAKPPVIEVAMSVQFDELAALKPVHYGLLWNHFRDRYPNTEHHAPLGSVIELYGAQGSQRATLQFVSELPMGRCWFLSLDGLRLIQIQPDRFVLNWRKLDTDTEYPSYDTLRELFMSELNVFLAFTAEHNLGEFTPTQCELTYVNHIESRRGWSARGEVEKILTIWSSKQSADFELPPVEDLKLNWQYRFDEQSVPIGRLHVQVQTAVRAKDSVPLLVMQLTARGAPFGAGVDGVLAFSDRGHEWIVRSFTALTTDHMHRTWERSR